MKNNLIKIFEETIISNHDTGIIINKLISLNIINLDDLVEEIIKTNNSEYIYELAYRVKGAPIDKLTDAIIKTGDAKYIFEFAFLIKNADIDKLQEYISKSEKYLKLIEEENYKTLIDLVKSNNYEQIEENKEEFATIFNDNKPKKLIKKKIK